jgi:hypothetical protein
MGEEVKVKAPKVQKFSIQTVHGGLMRNPLTEDAFTSEPSKPVEMDSWIKVQMDAGKLVVADWSVVAVTLTDYTSYDSIRAVLGVPDDELEDETLALEVYSTYLLMELEGVNADLPSAYVTAATLSEGARSAAQQRLYLMTRLFSTYAVANQLGSSLPMFGPKSTSDGKTVVTRFQDDPYMSTLERVKQEYDRLKPVVASALAQVNPAAAVAAVSRSLFAVSTPTFDPVTGSWNFALPPDVSTFRDWSMPTVATR